MDTLFSLCGLTFNRVESIMHGNKQKSWGGRLLIFTLYSRLLPLIVPACTSRESSVTRRDQTTSKSHMKFSRVGSGS